MERVSRSSRPWGWSVHKNDGLGELGLQAALHVFVHAPMGTAGLVIKHPGTELVYVTSVIPQNLLYGLTVSGLGGVDDRQRQRLPALVG